MTDNIDTEIEAKVVVPSPKKMWTKPECVTLPLKQTEGGLLPVGVETETWFNDCGTFPGCIS